MAYYTCLSDSKILTIGQQLPWHAWTHYSFGCHVWSSSLDIFQPTWEKNAIKCTSSINPIIQTWSPKTWDAVAQFSHPYGKVNSKWKIILTKNFEWLYLLICMDSNYWIFCFVEFKLMNFKVLSLLQVLFPVSLQPFLLPATYIYSPFNPFHL